MATVGMNNDAEGSSLNISIERSLDSISPIAQRGHAMACTLVATRDGRESVCSRTSSGMIEDAELELEMEEALQQASLSAARIAKKKLEIKRLKENSSNSSARSRTSRSFVERELHEDSKPASSGSRHFESFLKARLPILDKDTLEEDLGEVMDQQLLEARVAEAIRVERLKHETSKNEAQAFAENDRVRMFMEMTASENLQTAELRRSFEAAESAQRQQLVHLEEALMQEYASATQSAYAGRLAEARVGAVEQEAQEVLTRRIEELKQHAELAFHDERGRVETQAFGEIASERLALEKRAMKLVEAESG